MLKKTTVRSNPFSFKPVASELVEYFMEYQVLKNKKSRIAPLQGNPAIYY